MCCRMKATQRVGRAETRPAHQLETKQMWMMVNSRQGKRGFTNCFVCLMKSQQASLLRAPSSPVIKGAGEVNLTRLFFLSSPEDIFKFSLLLEREEEGEREKHQLVAFLCAPQ